MTDSARPVRMELIRTAALVVLLSLIPLRTLLSETPTFEVTRFMRDADTPAGATPGVTFAIATTIIAAAALVLFDALRRGRRIRFTGVEIGLAVILVAAFISIRAAGQKHLAFIGAIDFIASIVYLFTLRQLLARPWQMRLALLVIVSTAASVVVKCAVQRFIEWPDTIRYFEEHRAELTHADPKNPARPTGFEHDYEMRLRSGALTAYYGHPNILASQLILFLAASLAVTIDRRRRARHRLAVAIPAAVAAGLLVCLVGTQSKGALAALILSGVGWIGLLLIRKRLTVSSRAIVITGWMVAAVVAALLIGLLNARPDALGRSILFRTLYWQGARDMIADLGPFGVGPNNFGRHFTRYKPVDCPEEVESPHSWEVQLAAEWGVIGLAGFLLVAIGYSLRAAKSPPEPVHGLLTQTRAGSQLTPEPAHAHNGGQDRVQNEEPGHFRSIILWVSAIFAVAMAPWLVVIGESNFVFLALSAGFTAIPLFTAMIALSVESTKTSLLPDDPMPLMVGQLAVGLIGFLVHTSIDLALFSGGPATTFFAMAAVLLAVRQNRNSSDGDPSERVSVRMRPRAAIVVLAVGGIVTTALCTYFVVPCSMLAADLRTGRIGSRPSPWDTYAGSVASQAYRRANDVYGLDATAEIEWIEQLIPRIQSTGQADVVVGQAREAERRDPFNSLILAHLSAALHRRYDFSHSAGDLKESVEAYRRCLAAYPTDPNRHIYLANLMEAYSQAARQPAVLTDVVEHLREAMALEAKRVYVSLPNRIPAEGLQLIQQRIDTLASRPAEASASQP